MLTWALPQRWTRATSDDVAQGAALLDAGRPVAALASFEAAYRRRPRSRLLCLMGQARLRLGRTAGGLRDLRACLAAEPHMPPAFREIVEEEIAAARRKLALRLGIPPLRGPLPAAPPAGPGPPAAATTRALALSPEPDAASAPPGPAVAVRAAAAMAPAVAVAARPVPAPGARPRERRPRWRLGLGGAGLAAGLGLIGWAMVWGTLDGNDELGREPTGDPRVDRVYATGADAVGLLVGGVALTLTGTLLLAIPDRPARTRGGP